MKEVFYFLQWQWRRFEFWQKMFILAAGLAGSSTTAPEPYDRWLGVSGAAIILFFFAKWAIWDGVRSAWANYQEEKDKVIRILSAEDERRVK